MWEWPKNNFLMIDCFFLICPNFHGFLYKGCVIYFYSYTVLKRFYCWHERLTYPYHGESPHPRRRAASPTPAFPWYSQYTAAVLLIRISLVHTHVLLYAGCSLSLPSPISLGVMPTGIKVREADSRDSKATVSTCCSLSKLIFISYSMIGSLNLMDFSHCPLGWRSG